MEQDVLDLRHLQPGSYPGERDTYRWLGRMQVVESHYDSEIVMEEHSHSRHVLHVVLRGQVADLSPYTVPTAKATEVTFYPAGTPHTTHWQKEGRGLAVAFAPKDGESMMGVQLPERPILCAPGFLSALLFAMRRECATPDTASLLGAQSYLIEALNELGRKPEVVKRCSRASRALLQVRARLYDDWETTPTLTELASTAGIHPVYLARGFRAAFGETVGECLRKRRLDKSYRRMMAGESSLCQVAFEAGFSDQAHFTRTFRQYLGVPPSEDAHWMAAKSARR